MFCLLVSLSTQTLFPGWCANKSYVIATADLRLFLHASNLLPSLPTPLPYIIINTYVYETPLNHAGYQVVLQKCCNINVCIQYVISQSTQDDETFLRLDIRLNFVLHANGVNCTNLIDTRRGDSQSH